MQDELTLFQEDPPAKTSAWLDNVKDWMAQGADCSGINAVSLISQLPVGFCGRTSLVLCPPTEVLILLPCCGGSPAHIPGCPMEDGTPAGWWLDPRGGASGGCLTLNGSEWPSDAAVCSLSQVLENHVDLKYCLSPKACLGVLRRAERRGRQLPLLLQQALERVAQTITKDKQGI